MEEVLGDVEAVKEVAGLDEAAVLVAADAVENECLLFLSMVGVGPNLVRVRKFEILHRIFKVRRSSKFENKFTNLKICHFLNFF